MASNQSWHTKIYRYIYIEREREREREKERERVYCGSRPQYESLTVGTRGATVVEGQSRSGGQVRFGPSFHGVTGRVWCIVWLHLCF